MVNNYQRLSRSEVKTNLYFKNPFMISFASKQNTVQRTEIDKNAQHGVYTCVIVMFRSCVSDEGKQRQQRRTRRIYMVI